MIENEMDEGLRSVEPIGARVRKLMDHYRLNMNSLSTRLQLKSNSIITRVVKDPERGMSLELIQKILFAFPGIDPDWFVTGRGEMLRERPEKVEIKTTDKECHECAWKDEKIENLLVIIKSKDEVIAAKDALILNLQKTKDALIQ